MHITDLPARMQDKIRVVESGCWLWTAAKDKHGYGRVSYLGTGRFAHRVIYTLLIENPGKWQLDHLCRVHDCVNPSHLEPVSNRENSVRGIGPQVNRERFAAPRDCPHGHPMVGDNLLITMNKLGYPNRRCRACIRIAAQRRRWAAKGSSSDRSGRGVWGE